MRRLRGLAASDPIDGLTNDVLVNGNSIGQLRLHVGTHNYQPTGNEGIGRASQAGGRSLFYAAPGSTLGQTAQAAGPQHARNPRPPSAPSR